jgi:hypothetical protein
MKEQLKFDKILVSGCSFTSGYGMPGEHSNPNIWANLLSKKLGATTIKNAAQTGANNYFIFFETISELIKEQYDLVLVEWSAIPRYMCHVGLELYNVHTRFERDVNLVNKETLSKEWLGEIKNRLLRIHNDHWDILDLVKYVNVLIELQTKSRSGQIFFINGLGPWPDQYFTKKQINQPTDLTPYEQTLLQVDVRDDSEIFQLYNMIHEHYNNYGGIQEKYWLNLYQSQMKIKIDTTSSTDSHPGYASQQLFSDYFYQQIQNKTTGIQ